MSARTSLIPSGDQHDDTALQKVLAMKGAGEGFGHVTEKKIRAMHHYFNLVDGDAGGGLDNIEFKQVMHDPLFLGSHVSEATCDECFRKFDINGSGQLDFEEFLSAFHDMVDDDFDGVRSPIATQRGSAQRVLSETLQAEADSLRQVVAENRESFDAELNAERNKEKVSKEVLETRIFQLIDEHEEVESKMEAELIEYKRTLKSEERELSKCKFELKTAEELTELTQQELEIALAEVKALRHQNTDLRGENADMKTTLAALDDDNEILEDRMKRLSIEMASPTPIDPAAAVERDFRDETIADLRQQVQDLVDELDNQVRLTVDQKEDYESILNEMNESILNEAFDFESNDLGEGARPRRQNTTAALAELTGASTSADADAWSEELPGSVGALPSEPTAAERWRRASSIARLTGSLNKAMDEAATARRSAAELNAENSSLQLRLGEATQLLEESREQHSTMMATARRSAAELNAENSSLQLRLDEVTQLLEESREQQSGVAELRRRIRVAEADLAAAREDIERAYADNATLTAALDNAQTAEPPTGTSGVAELRRRIEIAEAELVSSREDIVFGHRLATQLKARYDAKCVELVALRKGRKKT